VRIVVIVFGVGASLALSGCVATIEPSANPSPTIDTSVTPEPSLSPPAIPSPLRPPSSPPAGNPAPD
jgi:hypothetical protein